MSAYLITPTHDGDDDSRLHSNLGKAFKYAFSSSPTAALLPAAVQAELPDHIKQSIGEWFKSTYPQLLHDGATAKDISISGILIHGDSHASASATHSPPPQSRLLALPPELRNRIYRSALLIDGDIDILSRDTQQREPGLLRTSRQTRQESRSIYYEENSFEFDIFDFDASEYLKWCRSSVERNNAEHTVKLRGAANWTNLLCWLEAEDYGKCGTLEADGTVGTAEAAAHLFQVVHAMRNVSGGVGASWQEAKQVLQSVRMAMAQGNSAWAD